MNRPRMIKFRATSAQDAQCAQAGVDALGKGGSSSAASSKKPAK